jgi:hypothetical protein
VSLQPTSAISTEVIAVSACLVASASWLVSRIFSRSLAAELWRYATTQILCLASHHPHQRTRLQEPNQLPLIRRIGAAIGALAWYGAACTLLAAIIYAREGTAIVQDGGLPLLQLVAVYVLVTVVSGVLLGLLQPFTRSVIGTGLVSIVVSWPSMLVVIWMVADRQMTRITSTDVYLSLGLAGFAGPFIAAYVHLRRRDGSANAK